MGTITAGTIIDDVAVRLYDTNNVQYARSELLSYLNEAQRQVVTLHPSSLIVRTAVQLAAGFQQTLPAGGYLLTDVVCSMGDDGTTPGHNMRQISQKAMSRVNDDWAVAAQVEEPTEWWADPQEPAAFWVNPPADGNGYLLIMYAKTPTVISSEATAIEVSDQYESALKEFMLARAANKKADYAAGPDIAAMHMTTFKDELGALVQGQTLHAPAVNMFQRRPDVQGSNQ